MQRNHIKSIFHIFFLAAPILHTPAFSGDFINPWEQSHDTKLRSELICPPVQYVSPNLSINGGVYLKDGITRDKDKDKEISNLTRSIRESATQAANLADEYQSTGDARAAYCAQKILLTLSQNKSLSGPINGYQAYFVKTWMLSSLSASWLKVMSLNDTNRIDANLINSWLTELAGDIIMRFNRSRESNIKKGDTSIANMYYWAALAAINTAIATGNNEYFDWAIGVFRSGLDQADEDGFLPPELKRKALAQHYHVFALIPLILIADRAQINGIDLYQYNNHALNRIVNATIDSYFDPTLIEKKSGYKQRSVPRPYFGWLYNYSKKFPNEKYDAILSEYPERRFLYIGGSPT
ncbi:hypothetical protein D8I35_14535 [Corticibacter populi]|uniref:Alginate lyase domain-containing protein n=1 Tax=Corticibacter populi TaxID=1550736 RepID=A0A3M6QNS2_9BURK|nr:alginate lyase family protein [Corticibacter populi]RMX04042.1 hypothetical protein D8I35_14535 [Corticibacter populi]RZS33041.1 poly(beta-D-mannuronate) lyase [Corticibacter populi]